MGLGKTLQSVALSWTLLKQGPYGGRQVVKRVLVVTPGSLVQNWGREFNKWLGRERIQVFTVDQVRFKFSPSASEREELRQRNSVFLCPMRSIGV